MVVLEKKKDFLSSPLENTQSPAATQFDQMATKTNKQSRLVCARIVGGKKGEPDVRVSILLVVDCNYIRFDGLAINYYRWQLTDVGTVGSNKLLLVNNQSAEVFIFCIHVQSHQSFSTFSIT